MNRIAQIRSNITPEREKELAENYKQDVRGATSEQRRERWLKHQAYLFKEDDRLEIFRDARNRARNNGGDLAAQYLAEQITPRQFFHRIQTDCMGLYARTLNRSRTADIDTDSAAFRALVREIAFEVLQIFERVDLEDKTQFCTAAAKVWHRFVESLHGLHGLPTVADMQRTNGSDSDAETAVLDDGDFETRLTPHQRQRWELIVA